MRQSARQLCISLLALTLGLSGACKKDGASTLENQALDEAASRGPSILDHVPADSPFVFSAIVPMPQEISDLIARVMGPLGDFFQSKINDMRREVDDPLGRALLDEIDGKLTREGLASLGISLRPRAAFYAIGWSLAARIELADGKKLAQAMDRIEAKGGRAAPRATFEGIEYRFFTEDDVTFVFAIVGNYAVAGLMHTSARDKVLPVLLGKTMPAQSIRPAVQSAMADYKLKGYSTMYVDSRAIVRMLTGEASPLSKEIMAVSEVELPGLSAVCRKELAAMAEVAPRLVLDYQEVTAKSMRWLMALELRPDLARELAGLRSSALALTELVKGNPLMAFGVNLDVNAALGWVRQKSAAMARDPYQCEFLAELNQGIAEAARELETPIPPFVSGFKAFGLVIKDFDTQGAMPTGQGYAVINMANPMALIDMAKAFVPQLAGVTVKPDGKPVSIALGLPGLGSVDLVVRDSWLGVAMGPGMTEALVSLIGARPGQSGPFAVFSYDYQSMMKKTGQLNAAGPAEQRMMEAITGMTGLGFIEMHFTERGLMFEQKAEFR